MEPLQPFAPLDQFDTPKSFQIAKQIEANIQSESEKQPEINGKIDKNESTLQNGSSTEISDKNLSGEVADDLNIEPLPAIKPLELPESILKLDKVDELQQQQEVAAVEDNGCEKHEKSNEDCRVVHEEPLQENITIKEEPPATEVVPIVEAPLQPDLPLVEPFELRTATGELYEPVVALEPLNLDDFLKPIVVDTSQNSSDAGAEIKQDKIKDTLKEIISDLDTYAEKDRELKESLGQSGVQSAGNLENQKQVRHN